MWIFQAFNRRASWLACHRVASPSTSPPHAPICNVVPCKALLRLLECTAMIADSPWAHFTLSRFRNVHFLHSTIYKPLPTREAINLIPGSALLSISHTSFHGVSSRSHSQRAKLMNPRPSCQLQVRSRRQPNNHPYELSERTFALTINHVSDTPTRETHGLRLHLVGYR